LLRHLNLSEGKDDGLRVRLAGIFEKDDGRRDDVDAESEGRLGGGAVVDLLLVRFLQALVDVVLVFLAVRKDRLRLLESAGEEVEEGEDRVEGEDDLR